MNNFRTEKIIMVTECPFGGILKHLKESGALAREEGVEPIFVLPSSIRERFGMAEKEVLETLRPLGRILRTPMGRDYLGTWSDARRMENLLAGLTTESAVTISHGHCAGRIVRTARKNGLKGRFYHMPHCMGCGSSRHNFFHGTVQNAFEWLLKDVADGMVACSQSERNHMIRFGIPPEKVVYAPNFIAASDSEERTQEEGLTGLAIVSRMVEGKGLEELLDILNFSGLGESSVAAGDGPMLQSFRERYPAFTFLGNVRNESVPSLLNSKVYISNSPYEGLSYALLEAMKHGAIPVVRNAPGLKDVICDGVNGFLFSDMDEMLAKLNVVLALPREEIVNLKVRVRTTAAGMSEAGMRIWTKNFIGTRTNNQQKSPA